MANRISKAKNSSREMRLYLKEISKIPLLTAEEEKVLGRKIQTGDTNALQKLVEANLRFVIKISKKYRGLGLSFLDLINEGNLGLMEAAKRFDPERNVRFTSYAVWWIRQSILHALSSSGHPLRIPARISNVMFRVGKSVAKKTAELKRKPSLQEIALDVGLSEKELASMMEVAASSTSLNQPITHEGDLVLEDVIAEDVSSVENLVGAQFLSKHVDEALEKLQETEKLIIKLRFGLDDGVPHTLKEIGDQMGLSRERIRQIESKALDKIRHSRKARTLSSYLN